jgi:hypothetical protein
MFSWFNSCLTSNVWFESAAELVVVYREMNTWNIMKLILTLSGIWRPWKINVIPNDLIRPSVHAQVRVYIYTHMYIHGTSLCAITPLLCCVFILSVDGFANNGVSAILMKNAYCEIIFKAVFFQHWMSWLDWVSTRSRAPVTYLRLFMCDTQM